MTSFFCIYFTLILAAHFKCSSSVLNYTSLGCWRDTINRAIPTMEGDPLFGTTSWYQRPNGIQLCAQVALKHGFQIFALQADGWCASSATARQTYNMYGASTACAANGAGGGWANQVYELVPPPQQCTARSTINYKSLGCWNDGTPSAIPSVESDPILGGSNYKARQNAREKCGLVAAKYGYTVFAVQDGGKCSTSASARQTYNKYGAATNCSDYGKGATLVNDVYELVPLPVTWHQYNGIEYAVSWNYSKTYNEAKSICSVCDATLALPRSVDVRALLQTLSLDQNLGYWIGLTKDATTNGSYLWQDGNPLLKSQENYAQGQPAPPTGITSFCMIADKTMKWKVGNCSSQRGYICQRPSANHGGIVSGQSKVGSREFPDAKKRITVLYDRCQAYKPVSVQANVTGMASLPDKFSVQLISSFTWGFEVEVVRTDQTYGWVQSTVYLNWTATFTWLFCSPNSLDIIGYIFPDSSTFDTNPCGFGVTCTNLIGGHVCDCGSGAVGSYCSGQTTVITGNTQVGSQTNAFGRKRVIVRFQRCHFQKPISVFAVVNGSSTLHETFTWKLVASSLWGFVADIIRTDAPSGWKQSTVYINWNARFDSNNSARNPCGIGRTCSVHAGGYTCTCSSSIVGSSSCTSSISNMTSIHISPGPASRNAKFVFDQCQAFRPNNVTASVLPTTAQTYTVAITRVYQWGFKYDITASSNFVNATTITLVWNAESEVGAIVYGSTKVGRRLVPDGKKRFTVVYDRCYLNKPVAVQNAVAGMTKYADKFSAQLVNSFSWGFEIDVVRSDKIQGWSQYAVYNNWTSTFNSTTFNTHPCGTGVNCTNLIGGYICRCPRGATGTYCSGPNTVVTGRSQVGSQTGSVGRKRITVKFQRCHFQKPLSVHAVVSGSSTLHNTFTFTLVASYLWGFVADVMRTDALSGWSQSSVYMDWNARFDTSSYTKNPCGERGTCSVHTGGYTCVCNSLISSSSNCTSSISNMTDISISPGPATRNATVAFKDCQGFRPKNVNASVLTTTTRIYTVAIVGMNQCGFEINIKSSSNFVNATTMTLVWKAYFEFGAIVYGSTKVGRRLVPDGKKRFTVVYDRCYLNKPVAVQNAVAGITKYADKFSAQVVNSFSWGFEINVVRSDKIQGWSQDAVYNNWTSTFNSTTFNTHPCGTGVNCTNLIGGYICPCARGATGTYCSGPNTVVTGRSQVGSQTGSVGRKRITVKFLRCHFQKPLSIHAVVSGSSTLHNTFTFTLVASYLWGFVADVMRTDALSGWSQSSVYMDWNARFDTSSYTKNPCGERGTCSVHTGGYTCVCNSLISSSSNCTSSISNMTDISISPGPATRNATVAFKDCQGFRPKNVNASVLTTTTRIYTVAIVGMNQCGFEINIKSSSNFVNATTMTLVWKAYFEFGAIVYGSTKVGRRLVPDGKKRFTVVYDRCYLNKPVAVQNAVAGITKYADKFSAQVVNSFSWGFEINVVRSDKIQGWSQDAVYNNWTSTFNSTTFNTHPCGTGVNCTNLIGGYICPCARGATGTYCSGPNTVVTGRSQVGSQTGSVRRKRITVKFQRCHFQKPLSVHAVVSGSSTIYDTFTFTLVASYLWGFVADVMRTDALSGWSQSSVYMDWNARFDTRSYTKNPCGAGGTCSIHTGGYTCVCNSLISGRSSCKTPDYALDPRKPPYGNPGPETSCNEQDGYGSIGNMTSIYLSPGPATRNATFVFDQCQAFRPNNVTASVLPTTAQTYTVAITRVYQWGFKYDITASSNFVNATTITLVWNAESEVVEIVHSATKIGPRLFGDGKKRITVVYDQCYLNKPVSVQNTVAGMRNVAEKFTAQLVNSFSWGFEIDVLRTDVKSGWSQDTVYNNWTSIFNSSTFNPHPCGAGVNCTNLIGGHVCPCSNDVVGSYCSGSTTVITGRTQVGSQLGSVGRKRITVQFQRCHFQEPISVHAVVTGSSSSHNTFTWELVVSYLWGFVADVIRTDRSSGWNQSTVYMNWNARFHTNNDTKSPCDVEGICTVHTRGYTCSCSSPVALSSNCTWSISNMTEVRLSPGTATTRTSVMFDSYHGSTPINATASVLPRPTQSYAIVITGMYRWGLKINITSSSTVVNTTTVTVVWNIKVDAPVPKITSTATKLVRPTTVYCDGTSITVSSKNASYIFPLTKAGQNAVSTKECANGNPIASVHCVIDSTIPNGAAFDIPQTIDCTATLASVASEVNTFNATTASVRDSMAKLKLLTTNTNTMTEAHVLEATSILSTLSQTNPQTVNITINTMYDALITANQISASYEKLSKSAASSNIRSNHTERQKVIKAMSHLANRFILPPNTTSIEISTAETTLQVTEPVKLNAKHAPVRFGWSRTAGIIQPVAVLMPGALFDEASYMLQHRVKRTVTTTTLPMRASIFLYNNSTLFPAAESPPSIVTIQIRGYQPSATSIGIHLDFTNTSVKQESIPFNNGSLKEKVTRTQCNVYQDSNGEWKPNGCSLVAGSFPPSCTCFKLASFSMIVSTKVFPSAFAQGIVSYVGCSLSIIGLVITLWVYLAVTELRRRQPTKFLINICFNLLMVNLIFVFGAANLGDSTGCYVSTALMHFFLLTTWFWMSANAYNMYKALTDMMHIGETSSVIPAVFCYLVPFLIVMSDSMLAVFYVDQNNRVPGDPFFQSAYRARNMCWLHLYSLNFGFLLPVGILALFNMICFILVIIKIMCRKSQIRSTVQKRKRREDFLIAISVCVVMGLTWLFGFMMMIADNVIYQTVMSWLFTIFNSTQGLFIFLMNCVRQKKVRDMWWLPLVACVTCKQQRSNDRAGSVSYIDSTRM